MSVPEKIDWYRLADQLPPYNAIVYLQWSGRIVRGCRLSIQGRDVWAEEASDGTRQLGIRVSRDGLWRPQNPEAWRLPLPPPVAASIVTGMTWTKQAMSEADAAALAEEMEADREAARARPDDSEEDRWGRWWRKGGLELRGEPAGQVTREMAEGRVMRALAHCGYGNRISVRWIYWADPDMPLWDKLGLTVDDIEALRLMAETDAETSRPPKFQPLPSDHRDFTTAMSWLVALNYHPTVPYRWTWHQRVLWFRACDEMMGWTTIGSALVGAHAHAQGKRRPGPGKCRALYAEAVDAIHRVANGQVAWPGRLLPEDLMEQLRTRNREAKRNDNIV